MSSTPLTVLLLEARPDEAAVECERLESAGHRVVRCHDHHQRETIAAHPSVPFSEAGWVPCTALTRGECPLDEWIDVALVVSDESSAGTPNGIGCAVRAGVPVVEEGAATVDPAPWIDRRATWDHVVEACEAAAVEAFAPVLARLRVTTGSLLREAGVDPADLRGDFTVEGGAAVIHLSGPPLPNRVADAVCERAVAALGTMGRRFRTIDASYRAD